MGLEAQRAAAFFCSMPHCFGVTGSSAEGTQLARGVLESSLAVGDFSSSFAWTTLVLCLPFSAGRAVWIHITYMAKCALIGQELVLKCQGKIYFPAQPLQVLIFLWAAR